MSRAGQCVVTVRFFVGEDREDSLLKLYNKIHSNVDQAPPSISEWVVKPVEIDDVPIVSATLWSEDENIGAYELGQVAHAIEAELKRVPGTRDIYTIGAADHVVAVELDPQALASHGLDPRDLRQALQAANVTRDNIGIVAHDKELLVQAGVFLSHADEIKDLVVGVHEGKAVFLRDVASVRRGPDTPQTYVWTGAGPAGADDDLRDAVESPAVTVVVAKKPGTNAVEIAQRVIDRFNQLEGIYIPDNVGVQVTRNYGATADAKAKKLIQKLTFATLSVVFLVLLAGYPVILERVDAEFRDHTCQSRRH